MDSIIGAVIGIVAFLFAVSGGFAISEATSAQGQLSTIAAEVSNEMAADGGFTYQVQQDTIAQLTQSGFNPALAQVTVTPGGWNPYGQTFSVAIKYPVPITIIDVSAFNVVVSSTQAGVSLYPCTASCPAPPSVEDPPGQGTGDLEWNPTGGTGSWSGP